MIITICIGSSCHLKGSPEVVSILEKLIAKHNLEKELHLTGSFCLGHCVKGVCVKFGDIIYSITPETTEDFFYQYIFTVI